MAILKPFQVCVLLHPSAGNHHTDTTLLADTHIRLATDARSAAQAEWDALTKPQQSDREAVEIYVSWPNDNIVFNGTQF